MLTRRSFVKQSAGTLAGLLVMNRAAQSQTRREVRVGGRRATTVDVHAHCEVPGIRKMMGDAATPGPSLLIGPDRLRAMDEQGIDVEVLSVNPFWYGVSDRDLADKLIRSQNEGLAKICAANPQRFVALATVSLQHPDLAAAQLEEGVKKLGLRGGSVGTNVGQEELASPRFDRFWAKANELRAPIFMHPQGVPELQGRLQGNGLLGNVIGNPLATTIALSHLIFEGTLDRFPQLQICAAHGGGYLPSYADRSDHGCLTFPEQCTKKIAKRPTEYLRQMFFDSLVFSGEALRHLVAAVGGPDRIMLGTDHPFPWTSTAVDHVLGAPGLSDDDRIAILGGNAVKLFRIN